MIQKLSPACWFTQLLLFPYFTEWWYTFSHWIIWWTSEDLEFRRYPDITTVNLMPFHQLITTWVKDSVDPVASPARNLEVAEISPKNLHTDDKAAQRSVYCLLLVVARVLKPVRHCLISRHFLDSRWKKTLILSSVLTLNNYSLCFAWLDRRAFKNTKWLQRTNILHQMEQERKLFTKCWCW